MQVLLKNTQESSRGSGHLDACPLEGIGSQSRSVREAVATTRLQLWSVLIRPFAPPCTTFQSNTWEEPALEGEKGRGLGGTPGNCSPISQAPGPSSHYVGWEKGRSENRMKFGTNALNCTET